MRKHPDKQPGGSDDSSLAFLEPLLRENLAGQDQLRQQLSGLESQNVFLAQQLAQLTLQVGQQLSALRESEADLRAELKRFQTGGAQHAMAAVFHKLFRDLIGHLNQLDDLALLGSSGAHSAEEQSWIEAIQVLRDGFESALAGWGCAPVPTTVFVDQFDPELHEAVAALEGEVPVGAPPNMIVLVRQRGWQLHGAILQYPQVVIS